MAGSQVGPSAYIMDFMEYEEFKNWCKERVHLRTATDLIEESTIIYDKFKKDYEELARQIRLTRKYALAVRKGRSSIDHPISIILPKEHLPDLREVRNGDNKDFPKKLFDCIDSLKNSISGFLDLEKRIENLELNVGTFSLHHHKVEGCSKEYQSFQNAFDGLNYLYGDLEHRFLIYRIPQLSESTVDLAKELLDNRRRCLFPILSDEGKRATDRYLSLTTIATFFSSITTTTIQYAQPLAHGGMKLGNAVNFFWYTSLVFSVSSGVNSLLGMIWRSSDVFYSYKYDLAPFVFILYYGPLFSLIISAITFIVGLGIFVFSSNQALFVAIATNTFAGLHGLVLFVVAFWLLYSSAKDKRKKKENAKVVLAKVVDSDASEGKGPGSSLGWLGKIPWYLRPGLKAIARAIGGNQTAILLNIVDYNVSRSGGVIHEDSPPVADTRPPLAGLGSSHSNTMLTAPLDVPSTIDTPLELSSSGRAYLPSHNSSGHGNPIAELPTESSPELHPGILPSETGSPDEEPSPSTAGHAILGNSPPEPPSETPLAPAMRSQSQGTGNSSVVQTSPDNSHGIPRIDLSPHRISDSDVGMRRRGSATEEDGIASVQIELQKRQTKTTDARTEAIRRVGNWASRANFTEEVNDLIKEKIQEVLMEYQFMKISHRKLNFYFSLLFSGFDSELVNPGNFLKKYLDCAKAEHDCVERRDGRKSETLREDDEGHIHGIEVANQSLPQVDHLEQPPSSGIASRRRTAISSREGRTGTRNFGDSDATGQPSSSRAMGMRPASAGQDIEEVLASLPTLPEDGVENPSDDTRAPPSSIDSRARNERKFVWLLRRIYIWQIMKWIWKMVKWPFEKFKHNLHLQRNIFWALGIDNRVARLNYAIDWDRDWPEPYLISKLIRLIAYPIKKCWLATKKAFSALNRTVRAHICLSSRMGHAGSDVELGERVRREEVEVPEETSSPDEKAKDEFRNSLQKVFSEADCVERIMRYVGYWGSRYDEVIEKYIGYLLWGYPALVNEFHEGVRPALIDAHERRRREIEEVERQETTTDADNIPEVVGQDEHDTRSVLPLSSQTACLDNGSGSSDVRQTDVQQDGPPPYGHSFTAPAFMEALKPTSGDPDLPLHVSRIGEGPTLSNEIEEVASTSDYEDERSVAQRKGKARE